MVNIIKVVVHVLFLSRRDPTDTVASPVTSLYTVIGTTLTTGTPDTLDGGITGSTSTSAVAIPSTTLISSTTISSASAAISSQSSLAASTLETVVLSSIVSSSSVVSATFTVPVAVSSSSSHISSAATTSSNVSMIMVPFTSVYTIVMNGSYVHYSPQQVTSSIVSAVPSSIKSIASTNDIEATLAISAQFAYGDPPWFSTLPYDITRYYHSSSSLMTLFSYVATAHGVQDTSTPSPGDGGGGSSTGASIGIGVGVGVGGLVLIICLVVVLLSRRRKRKPTTDAPMHEPNMVEGRSEVYKSELPGDSRPRAELDSHQTGPRIHAQNAERAELSAVNER